VKQQEAFRIPYPHPANGGTLVTAGNLLVEGTIAKTFAIYRADNGKKLWEMPVESVPVSGPMTYAIGGTQYIAVNAGWNSAIVHRLNEPTPFFVGPAFLLVFKLDAQGLSVPAAPPPGSIEPPPTDAQPADKVEAGALLYSQQCATCHGQNATGGVKDLRFLSAEKHAQFPDIVLGGKLKEKGMESFADRLSAQQVDAIHSYVISRGQEDYQPDFTRPRRPPGAAPGTPPVAPPQQR
jgi:quinohemoprotein ethanol dehydrogenase